jgi:arabinofuranosyltransferase
VGWPFVLGATGLLLAVIVRAAWLCDDAYITLRTVDNIVNGYGPRWNVVERVQTFTHPAWMLLMTPFYAITREAYFTVIGLQLALAALMGGVCFRLLAGSVAAGAVGLAAFGTSRAFVDFSTSGLENGLAHVLIVVFLMLWLRGRARPGGVAALGLVSAGLMLCRLDLAALIVPMVVTALWPIRRDRVVSFVGGCAPFLLWEAFSFVYYGQAVPNTALAKLPPGVPASELAAQGVRYLAATFHFDPVTPIVVALSSVLLVWRGGATGRTMAAGIVLHVLAVVAVGGDFMAGRFLTPAFVAAVAGLISMRGGPRSGRVAVIAVSIFLAIAMLVPGTPFRTTADFGTAEVPAAEFARHGVTDERRFYNPSLGLLRVVNGRASPSLHPWAVAGGAVRAAPDLPESRVRAASNVGLFGYYAGPAIYVIDRNALTDPFLARVPPDAGWRVGHYTRTVSEDYVASRRAGRNLMIDPDLHRLYAQVELLTQGAIWRRDRLGLLVTSIRPATSRDRRAPTFR